MVLEKRLLCISDLEGCQGAEALCKKESYDAIIAYLNDDKMENHIVFLGDYFDQGPHMIESINGIGRVIDNFGPDSSTHRAHIILGNRDINKLRILYDALSYLEKPSNTWSTWNNYMTKGLDEKEVVTKLQPGYIIYDANGISIDHNALTREKTKISDILKKYIDPEKTTENLTIFDKKDDDDFRIKKMRSLIACTYGAPNLLRNIIEEVKTLGEKITEMDAIYIIGSIFMDYGTDITEKHTILNNQKIKEFQQNCRKLFFYGKLISNFNIEGFGNVLMSHGGSYSPYIFNLNPKYYDKIMNDVIIDNTSKYFEIMEEVRKKFAESNFTNIDNTRMNLLIDYHINQINSIYETFIKDLYEKKENSIIIKIPNYIDAINTGINGSFDFAKRFYILQSLGLNLGTGEKGFVSPIASCGMTPGCGGLNKDKDNEKKILNLFKSLNIKYVVNGHIPHCTSVPVIYTRDKNNGIVFVNNDTSVGYTQEKQYLRRIKGNPDDHFNKNISKIPLAYLTSKNVGITALTPNGKTENANIDTDYETYNYKLLVSDWDYNKTPFINAAGNIESDTFILEFNTKRLPLTIKDKSITSTTSSGGKKSRRRRGKSGRVSKRRHKKICKNMHCKRCG